MLEYKIYVLHGFAKDSIDFLVARGCIKECTWYDEEYMIARIRVNGYQFNWLSALCDAYALGEHEVSDPVIWIENSDCNF